MVSQQTLGLAESCMAVLWHCMVNPSMVIIGTRVSTTGEANTCRNAISKKLSFWIFGPWNPAPNNCLSLVYWWQISYIFVWLEWPNHAYSRGPLREWQGGHHGGRGPGYQPAAGVWQSPPQYWEDKSCLLLQTESIFLLTNAGEWIWAVRRCKLVL